jgi:acetolactate synthase I/II/III large subunit
VHAAQQDSTPLLALVGQVSRGFRHREAFQEVDLVAFFAPITKWAAEAVDAARLPELIHKAIHIATSGRPGPVLLALPEDVLNDVVAPSFFAPARPALARPAAADVARTVALLKEARRPVIVAGAGVLRSPGACEHLVELAELSATPVMAGWRRFDVFPHDHLLYLGATGLGGPPCVGERLLDADVLLVVGSRLGEIGSHDYRVPAPHTRVVQIDIAAEQIGANCSPTVAMLADAGLALDDLCAAIRAQAGWDAVRAARQEMNMRARQRFVAESAPPPPIADGYVDPALVVAELQRLLPPEAMLVSDVGNFSGWLARYYRFTQPGTFLGPTSGAMGYGLPAAIAAKLAHPTRPVVAFAGDGSLLMTLTELETAVRAKTPLVVVVFDNQMYGTIRMHQEQEHPGRVVATRLSTPDLVRTAEAFGAFGVAVKTNAEVAPALRAALAAARPALVHVPIDPTRIAVGKTMDLRE